MNYGTLRKPVDFIPVPITIQVSYSLLFIPSRLCLFHCLIKLIFTSTFLCSNINIYADEEPERKLHVEIKPINNGTALPGATVDELKATIESFNINSTAMFNTTV